MSSLIIKKAVSLVILIFFVTSIYNLCRTISSHKEIFIEKYDFVKYQTKFHRSQWMITNKKFETMSDADLYAFAASTYLRGKDPTFVNFETPPLGKYLIAVSLIVFNNQRVISLFFAFFSLIFIYYLTFLISRSNLASILAISMTMNSWFFIDQIINSPQMEIYQLFFLLVLIIFLAGYEKTNKTVSLVLASIAAGAFASLKAFHVHLLLTNFFLVSYFIYRKKALRQMFFDLVIVNGLMIAVLTAYYLGFFLNGGSFLKFLKFQKWTVDYYTIHSRIKLTRILGSYLTLIYANRWKFWSEGYPIIKYNNWSISWPIIHLTGIMSLIFFWFKKIKVTPAFQILVTFIIIYSIFLFFIPIWPRYLLLLYVPLFIIISSSLISASNSLMVKLS